MTDAKTSASEPATLPRPVAAIQKDIEDALSHCEWIVDAYDARNDAPADDRRVGNPGVELENCAAKITTLFDEAQPWLERSAFVVMAERARLHEMRRHDPSADGAPHRIQTVVVGTTDGSGSPAPAEKRRVPAEIAALLDWTETIDVLKSTLEHADRTGDWDTAIGTAKTIATICRQVHENWTPPEGRNKLTARTAWWPRSNGLKIAAPKIADEMMDAVLAASSHLSPLLTE